MVDYMVVSSLKPSGPLLDDRNLDAWSRGPLTEAMQPETPYKLKIDIMAPKPTCTDKGDPYLKEPLEYTEPNASLSVLVSGKN
jgi:hypothetical protein